VTYPGYITIGLDDQLDPPFTQAYEITNTNRAMAYARTAGITWINDCDECEIIEPVIPNGGPYSAPDVDPAPWWHAQRPASTEFLGVVGLELAGSEDSTRTARVTSSLSGGGSIGRTYEQARTMTLRAIAIASSDRGLSYGLRWLSEQFISVGGDPCFGDPLTFFEYCPDVTCPEEDVPVGPCWPDDYSEMDAGPPCTPDWWPSTYAEWMEGPPYLQDGTGGGDWCDWPGTYRELRTWLPPWSCCYELNVIPAFRQFANSRVTEGPIVLRRPHMSMGAMAEIEFTIVAADPTATRHLYYWADTWVTPP
jgi:hypothetical protein